MLVTVQVSLDTLRGFDFSGDACIIKGPIAFIDRTLPVECAVT